MKRLEETGKPTKNLTMYSPMTGVVTKKDIVMGHRLNEGDMPYEITDLARVWVLADAYETDLARIQLGMTATLSLQAFPNKTFKGKVIFIDPDPRPKTRTAKVRLEFSNPKGELKPEMYGEVTLLAETRDGTAHTRRRRHRLGHQEGGLRRAWTRASSSHARSRWDR